MAYEYVEIHEETNLISNFKRQLEKHNAKELALHGRTELTDNEFNKVMLYLEGGTTFEKAKKLRDLLPLELDNGQRQPLRPPRSRAKEKVHRQNAPLPLTRKTSPLQKFGLVRALYMPGQT